jgi:hypothetical protein
MGIIRPMRSSSLVYHFSFPAFPQPTFTHIRIYPTISEQYRKSNFRVNVNLYRTFSSSGNRNRKLDPPDSSRKTFKARCGNDLSVTFDASFKRTYP